MHLPCTLDRVRTKKQRPQNSSTKKNPCQTETMKQTPCQAKVCKKNNLRANWRVRKKLRSQRVNVKQMEYISTSKAHYKVEIAWIYLIN